MVFSGKKTLPNKETMLNDINVMRGKRKLNSEQAQRLDRVCVMDSIATELDLLPDFNKIKENEPKLYDMIWNK